MTMSSEVNVFRDHIEVEIAGEYAAGAQRELADLVASLSEQHRCKKFLVDLRAMQGIIPNMSQFAAGLYSAQIWKKSLRTAVVLPRSAINKFFENTAYNRGVQTLVVATLEEARSWLGVSD